MSRDSIATLATAILCAASAGANGLAAILPGGHIAISATLAVLCAVAAVACAVSLVSAKGTP